MLARVIDDQAAHAYRGRRFIGAVSCVEEGRCRSEASFFASKIHGPCFSVAVAYTLNIAA
jgi:hypothetical protein